VGAAPETPPGEGEAPNPYDHAFASSAWHELWAERQDRFERGIRYRLGAPFTPLLWVEELSRDGVAIEVREGVARELWFWCERAHWPGARDWTERQLARLAALKAALAASPLRPGEWLAGRR
jgi:hypothetical protein